MSTKNLVITNPNGYFLKQVKNKATEILKYFEKEDGSDWSIENDGLIIEITLVSALQESALEARKSHLTKLQKSMDTYWNIIKHKKNIQSIINNEWHQTKTYKRYKNAGLTDVSIKDSSNIKKNRFVFN